MYSVIIVDDEPAVREGMNYLIDWEKAGFCVIDSAENGLEGLELIEKERPDLVITDIKMPGLNGLGMIKEAKKKESSSRFILLSGYSDFKYAQEAISYGAIDYLLKPIDENELLTVLKKVEQQLVEETRDKKNKKHFQSYLENQTLFSYIIHKERKDEINHLSDFSAFQLIKLIRKGEKLVLQDFVQICEKCIEDNYFLYTYGDSLFMLIAAHSEMKTDQLIAELKSDTRLKATISSVGSNVDDLPNLYGEIKFLESQRYFYPDTHVLTKQSINKKAEIDSLEKLIIKLKIAIKDNQKDEIEQIVDWCVDYFQATKQDSGIVKREWSMIFIECVSFLEESMQKPIKEIEKDKILSVVWKEDSLYQTAKFLKYVFYDFGRFFYQTNEKQDIIEDIKFYSEKNYHLNLSLKDLAQEFNYSQSYLGKKFKTDTGKSYHLYLDDLRLTRAKNLLKDKHLYIYEIAKMVGYSNYDYFHKKFKKKFSISPKEYQKKWRDGEQS
ncbi:response regulator transcription factor [Alkalibacterium olivapovliticus]|uniref:Two-component system response regulator YesN n=1 Tax=Alkalibacterium olivapovliticus TaxID=99907 RepID=A0A2T0W5K8_9LACT|nr:response regulator [Alkalibacterium olivapovliticus]PRY81356.1 two-component system response regulator YesN [Alkalibacterium olivapovliticus]